MDVVLLGTGSGDGWPNPFCRCASCTAVRRLGPDGVRGSSSALVDGRLLLDAGPDAGLAASRHGVSLAEVTTVLLTHAHCDHVSPPLLLWRSWIGHAGRLEVVGPQPALDLLTHWIGPADPVQLRPVVAGDAIELDGYRVAVLAAAHGDDVIGPGVLYDVTAADGARLLYATDTGPLPTETVEAVRDAAFDVVLLEETFGDWTEHAQDHLDLRTFPAALAALRGAGAVVERTRVAPIHLGHRNPPPRELASRLAQWGVELLPDGARLAVGPAADATTAPSPVRSEALPRRTLVTGGARSGKSRHAESLLASAPAVSYVATAVSDLAPGDEEWAERVALHRARRPATWQTVETVDLVPLLAALSADDPPMLVDCLTVWLTATMTRLGCWADDRSRSSTQKALDDALAALVDAWERCAGTVVAVTNEVGDGVVPDTVAGRWFRDELGRLNAAVAAVSDAVWHTVVGLPQRLR